MPNRRTPWSARSKKSSGAPRTVCEARIRPARVSTNDAYTFPAHALATSSSRDRENLVGTFQRTVGGCGFRHFGEDLGLLWLLLLLTVENLLRDLGSICTAIMLWGSKAGAVCGTIMAGWP